jgi:hypothetical protein
MEVLPVDIVALFAVTLGCMTVLIPIAGFTARFALKPLVEAIAQARSGRNRDAEVAMLEQRLHLLERQVELLQRGLPQGEVLGAQARPRGISQG